MSQIYSAPEIMPSQEEVQKIVEAKLAFEAAQIKPDKDAWNKQHFTKTPWGIAFTLSKKKFDQSTAFAKQRGWKAPVPKANIALKYLIIAVAIDWQDLIKELKRTLRNWGYSSADLQSFAKQAWQDPINAQAIANMCEMSFKTLTEQTIASHDSILVEEVTKHNTLNSKLFTKTEVLKETVRKKMLEIVDEFLDNLREQNIEIKVDDVLLVGSNANYNYTKDSDIDLHIIANTKNMKYEMEIANALYSAYRTLFNKNLDINIYDIPLELYVEVENTPRNSNGVYSVKKDKWEKKPVQEEIPEYDKEALNKLVDKWEKKCKDLLDRIAADKLDDEKQVVKLIEDIYEQLRKAGVAKSEYAVENLAFKELRNKGYLDKLKSAKHELISKRLSLEEHLIEKSRRDAYIQIARAAGSAPMIQDNGMFFIYNIKESEINSKVRALKSLPIIQEVFAQDSGKYDFNDVLRIATHNLPAKYYNIRGQLIDDLCK
jgi:predicted nucleotidyltransferase